jgi:hypothetical protein
MSSGETSTAEQLLSSRRVQRRDMNFLFFQDKLI